MDSLILVVASAANRQIGFLVPLAHRMRPFVLLVVVLHVSSAEETGVVPVSHSPIFCPGLPTGGYDQTCSLCSLDKACMLTCIDCGGSSLNEILHESATGAPGSPISATCDLTLGCRSVIDNKGVLECADGEHKCKDELSFHEAMSTMTMLATALCVTFLGSLVISSCNRLSAGQNCDSLLSLVHLSPYHECTM
jgi:hypothetical protein